MPWKNTTQHYGILSLSLHWIMFLLMIAVYATIELRELFPKGSDPREALKALHFMLGLSVLILVIVRIYISLISPSPLIAPALPKWQQFSAKLGHLTLYALMIGMPFLGWALLSAAGNPIPFFGLEFPPLVVENKLLAKTLKEIHVTMGTIGYFLIGIHIAAALYHHHIRKDNTLIRMLPKR